MEIPFGSKVQITHKFIRGYKRNKRNWIKKDYVRFNCLLIGKRFLKNGKVIYDSDGIGTFIQSEIITCYLIVITEFMNPIYVPIDCTFKS